MTFSLKDYVGEQAADSNGRVPDDWPQPLDEAAFHGPAGRFVETIAPHSEADVAALLGHYLVIAGNLFGTDRFYQVEGDRHPPRLYGAFCGPTATGRKGTAYSRARQVAQGVDPEWSDRVGGGLSSGEGPLWHVRDPIKKLVEIKKDGKRTGTFEERVEDPGVPDKRLLIVEVELSRHFDVMLRSGNTLSETVRRLWDGGVVGSMTKNSPIRSTDPHVSIIGHISRSEVRRKLTEAESASGFANRFLWFAVRRRQALPFGGDLAYETLLELRQELADAVSKVHRLGEQRLMFETGSEVQGSLQDGSLPSGSAAERWAGAYDELAAEREGMVGAITARAAPQVIRLAVTYALLDVSTTIELPHLQAALAVWDYCRRSAAWIFGDATGDPLADMILRALVHSGDAGLTRTEIRELVGGRHSVERVETALAVLLMRNVARFADEGTGGRRAQRWHAIRERER